MTLNRHIKIFLVLEAVVSGWLISGVSVGFAFSTSTIEESYQELMHWHTVQGAEVKKK